MTKGFVEQRLLSLAATAKSRLTLPCKGNELLRPEDIVHSKFKYRYMSLYDKTYYNLDLSYTATVHTQAFLAEHGLLADIANIQQKWLLGQMQYLRNLSVTDRHTLNGYTFQGDVFANTTIRQTFAKEFFKKRDAFEALKVQMLYLLPTIKESEYTNAIVPGSTSVRTQIERFNSGNMTPSEQEDFEYMIVPFLHIPYWKRAIRMFIHDLRRIISSAPPLPSNLYVFRGVTTPYHKTASTHAVFDNKGFVSTTLNPYTANRFAGSKGYVQRILLPAGAHVLITFPISKYPDEAEVLLPDGAQFKLRNGSRTMYLPKEDDQMDLCLLKAKLVKVTDIIMDVQPTSHALSKSSNSTSLSNNQSRSRGGSGPTRVRKSR